VNSDELCTENIILSLLYDFGIFVLKIYTIIEYNIAYIQIFF
jgi:hypothetical protein